MKHQVENRQGPQERGGGFMCTRESLLGGGAPWVCAPAHLTCFRSNQPSWNDIVQVLCQSLNCKLRQDNKHAR